MVLASAYAARLILETHAEEAASNLAPKGREFIMVCDTYAKSYTHEEVSRTQATRPGPLYALDVAAGETTTINLPFFGHIVNQHPLHTSHVLTFEKWGHHGAVIDITSKKIVAMMEPYKGHEFFGHLLFNTDGTHFVDSEFSANQAIGKLAVRDSSTMQIVDTYSSYGARPHGSFSSDNGKTIMVANGGHGEGTSNISWIDFASGKLLHQLDMKAGNYIDYQHVDMSHDGWFCIVGKSTRQTVELIKFISPDGRVYSPDIPENLKKIMHDETLSIAMLGKSGLVAVTIPKSDVIVIIDYKTQKLVEAITLDYPRGALPSLDPRDGDGAVLATLGKARELISIKVDADHKKPVTHLVKNHFGGIGSHMTRMYI